MSSLTLRASQSPHLVLVGRFGAAQGVRGEIRIKSFTADPRDIANYGALTDETGARHEIVGVRPLRDDLVVARLKGVNDRNGAEALTGRALHAARAQMPPPGEDEFYIADLIGMSAVAPDGAALGTVKNVVNYGAGDILEISGAGETFFAPFTKTVVPTLDFGNGRIVVARPRETE